MKKLFIALVAFTVAMSLTETSAIAAPYTDYHQYQKPKINVQETWTNNVKGNKFSKTAEGGSLYGGGNVSRYDISTGTYYEADEKCYQNYRWNGLFYVKNGTKCVKTGTYTVVRGDEAFLELNYKTKSFNLSVVSDNPKKDTIEFYSGWYNPAPNKKTYIKSALVVTKTGKTSARISNVIANKANLFFTILIKDMKGTKRYLYKIKSVWPDPTISELTIDGKDCTENCSFDVSRNELLESHSRGVFNDNKVFPSEYDSRTFWTKNYTVDVSLGGNYLKGSIFGCDSNTEIELDHPSMKKNTGVIDSSSAAMSFYYTTQTYNDDRKTIYGEITENGHTYMNQTLKKLQKTYWGKPEVRFNNVYNKTITLSCWVSGYKPTGTYSKSAFYIPIDIQISFNNLNEFTDGTVCTVTQEYDASIPVSQTNWNDRPCTFEESELLPVH